MTTYVVFAVLAGIPDRGNMKVFNATRHPELLKRVTLGYAKRLCIEVGLSLKEEAKNLGVDDLVLGDFNRGIGEGENTVFIYEVDIE